MSPHRVLSVLGVSVPLGASVLVGTPIASAQDAEDPAMAEESTGLGDDNDDAADDDDADSDDGDGDNDDEGAAPADTGHMFQFGVRAGFVLGYRMFFRYDDSPFCQEPEFTPGPGARTDKENSVCGFGAPPATELALSFAPLDSIEPYIFTRLGLSGEEATDTEALRILGVGVRIYTMSDDALKLFVEPAVAYEFEGAGGDPDYCSSEDDTAHCAGFVANYKKDLVFHLGIGPQYDFARYVGLYLNAGLDVGVFRAIHATLFGNLGVQGRFP